MLNVIGKRKWYFGFSGILLAASLFALIAWGLKPGIDFTGGSLLEVSFTESSPKIEELQSVLSSLAVGNVTVQTVEANHGVIMKMRFISEEEHQKMLTALREKFEKDDNKMLEVRLETVGPAISAQLRARAFGAGAAVLLAILVYIAYAFRKVSRPVKSWKYGVAAILALIHDVGITLGTFAFLGKYMGVEVDIPFVVAALTVLGYSVNDTIVVFDRIRENLIKYGSDQFETVVNRGVNETLLRSLNTSFTVLLTLFALFFFGGASIHYFALALLVGITAGTYSSIFIASPILVVWHMWSSKN